MIDRVRYMRINYYPNIEEDQAGRILKRGKLKRFKVGIRYYDENNRPTTQPNASHAYIVSINDIKYNDSKRDFTSRKEIKETVYNFMYKLYNIADGIATQ